MDGTDAMAAPPWHARLACASCDDVARWETAFPAAAAQWNHDDALRAARAWARLPAGVQRMETQAAAQTRVLFVSADGRNLVIIRTNDGAPAPPTAAPPGSGDGGICYVVAPRRDTCIVLDGTRVLLLLPLAQRVPASPASPHARSPSLTRSSTPTPPRSPGASPSLLRASQGRGGTYMDDLALWRTRTHDHVSAVHLCAPREPGAPATLCIVNSGGDVHPWWVLPAPPPTPGAYAFDAPAPDTTFLAHVWPVDTTLRQWAVRALPPLALRLNDAMMAAPTRRELAAGDVNLTPCGDPFDFIVEAHVV